MIDGTTVLTILLMACVTYATRIGGYIVLRKRTVGARTAAVMEAAPGCVLISVIAPDFVSGNLADVAALTITVLAATRLSILPTVLIGIASAGVLRQITG